MLKESCQENDCLKAEIFRLSNVVQDCLEIKGIPLNESETTDLIMQQLGKKIRIDVTNEEIAVSHHLPLSQHADQNKYPIIIAKFVGRNVRDKYYEAWKNLKGKSM